MPALGIYGLGDWVVNPNQADVMAQYVPHAQVGRWKPSRHFPMADEPERFNQALKAAAVCRFAWRFAAPLSAYLGWLDAPTKRWRLGS